MKAEKVNQLNHGLYRLKWKSGGSSLASVGSLANGQRWFSCCNWTSNRITGISSTDWKLVKSAKLIKKA